MQPQKYKMIIRQVAKRYEDQDWIEFFMDADHEGYNDGTFEWYSFLSEAKKLVDWMDEQCQSTGHDYNDRADGICMLIVDGGIKISFSEENKGMASLFKMTFC